MPKKNIVLATLLASLTVLLTFSLAFAHGHIPVGKYEMVIGWASEPPIVGEPNAITIAVSDTTAKDKEVDASQMTATISYGGQTKTLTLGKSRGTTNQYEAHIIPIVAGTYTVQVRGKLGGDTDINVDFEPEEVSPIESLAFPSTSAAQQPTSIRLVDWVGIGALVIALAALVLSLRKSR